MSRFANLSIDHTSPSGLRWKGQVSPQARAGDAAGYFDASRGYWVVSVDYVLHGAHRIVFELHHGRPPEGEVDHLDGVKTNNVPDNLRDATPTINSRNRRMAVDNLSGHTGLSHGTSKRGYEFWSAHWIDNNGKRHRKEFSVNKHGADKAFELARAAREAAIAVIGGYTERHGKSKT